MGRFCRLEILNSTRIGGRLFVVCKCDCGKIKTFKFSHVKSGGVKSCGCLKLETTRKNGLANRRHGQSVPGKRTGTYRSWETMKSRCMNKSDPSFSLYGGRGIKVCKRWMKFDNFLKDMGDRARGETIDRINVNGDYESSNCRWATRTIQQRNKRNNRLVLFRGKTVPLIVVSEETGVPYSRLWERIVRRGWGVEDAISKPSIAYV